jgi:hypothetical protein
VPARVPFQEFQRALEEALSASTSFLASAWFTPVAMVSVTSNLQRIYGPGCAFPRSSSEYLYVESCREARVGIGRKICLLHSIEAMKVAFVSIDRRNVARRSTFLQTPIGKADRP